MTNNGPDEIETCYGNYGLRQPANHARLKAFMLRIKTIYIEYNFLDFPRVSSIGYLAQWSDVGNLKSVTLVGRQMQQFIGSITFDNQRGSTNDQLVELIARAVGRLELVGRLPMGYFGPGVDLKMIMGLDTALEFQSLCLGPAGGLDGSNLRMLLRSFTGLSGESSGSVIFCVGGKVSG